MTTKAIEGLDVAKPKGRPRKPGGEGGVVRIDPDLAVKAKYLATRAGKPLSDYLSDILRSPLEREFRKVGRELMDKDDKE